MAPRRPRRSFACAVVALALVACSPRASAPAPLLFGLQDRLGTIASLTLRGAGGATIATLERAPEGWRVRERTGWRADRAEVKALLADLAGATRLEARTSKPERYAKIGVEPVAKASAESEAVEVVAAGKGWTQSLLVGTAPTLGAGRFVRVPDEAGAWLTGAHFDFPRTTAGWLDTHLLDVPLAHVVYVQSHDALGHAFALAHRDDRFRVVDVPSAAMGDSYEGDALAGTLEGLRLEDVAADDGAAAERVVRFGLHDDRVLQLEAWRVEGRVWVRVLDCDAKGCAAHGKFAGRRFLLPPHESAKLLLTREQILNPSAPAPPPAAPAVSQQAVAEALRSALQGQPSPDAPPADDPKPR